MPANCQLYVKTGDLGAPIQAPPEHHIVFDIRNLPGDQLSWLYGACNAFVLVSCGEGWGLTLTEAMATGLPCIWTAYSAPLDYADASTGFPITDFEMIPFWREGQKVGDGPPAHFGAAAKEEAIIANMKAIVSDYPAALERGRRASERMHGQYTWRQAAERFVEICRRLQE